MSRTDPQYNLRLPGDLRDQVKKAAEKNKRSMNAEIIARLERSFSEKNGSRSSELQAVTPEESAREIRETLKRIEKKLEGR